MEMADSGQCVIVSWQVSQLVIPHGG